MKNQKAWALLICLLPLISLAQQKVEKTFSGIEEIDISVASGDAVFKKSNDDKVYLTLTHDMDDYNPKIEQRGDKLRIEEDRDKNGRWSGRVLWEFQIPDDMEIEFNTGSGDAEFSNLTVDSRINSGSGDLEFSDVKGEVRGNTGSGDINFRNSSGDFKMNTGSGDIDGRNLSGYMTMNSGSGDVQISDLTLEDASSFNSGSGDVEISLASSLDYDISVNSGSGDAVVDFQGNKIEGLVVMRANKRNGRIVAPFKFDKEEEVDNGGRNNVTIKKTAQIGSKDVRISISTGSGTAEIEK